MYIRGLIVSNDHHRPVCQERYNNWENSQLSHGLIILCSNSFVRLNQRLSRYLERSLERFYYQELHRFYVNTSAVDLEECKLYCLSLKIPYCWDVQRHSSLWLLQKVTPALARMTPLHAHFYENWCHSISYSLRKFIHFIYDTCFLNMLIHSAMFWILVPHMV